MEGVSSHYIKCTEVILVLCCVIGCIIYPDREIYLKRRYLIPAMREPTAKIVFNTCHPVL